MSAATTVVSKTVDIDAPVEHVWSVLTDLAAYPQWNPFTVAVDSTLRVGDPVDLTLPNPDGSGTTFVTREWIRLVDPPHRLQYGTDPDVPGLLAVRDQWLEPVGSRRCRYRTEDAFTGEHAEAVFAQTGQWVRRGFDAVADALKDRAEQLWRAG